MPMKMTMKRNKGHCKCWPSREVLCQVVSELEDTHVQEGLAEVEAAARSKATREVLAGVVSF